MPKNEVTITEIEEFDPERVDGVGKGANGFPILMLKTIDSATGTVDSVTRELDKATDDRKDCETCDGTGKIMQGNRKCPDCMGAGKGPKVGETAKQYIDFLKEAGVAASSANDPYPTGDCPTCNGSGTIADNTADGKSCPDCGGTGKDQNMTNPEELKAVPGDAGRISVGDPQGRETLDKAKAMKCACGESVPEGADRCPMCGEKVTKGNDADGFRPAPYKADPDETVQCPKCDKMNDTDAAYCDQCGHELMGDDDVIVDGKSLDGDDDDAMKAKGDAPKGYDPNVGGGVKREDVPDEDHAGKNRSFPIVTPGDVSDAASSLGRAGEDNFSTDKIKQNIISIAQRKGKEFVSQLPQKWKDEMAQKGDGEDLATILRHDKGHDDWHAMHGDEPCTSEADCKAKAAKYDDAEKAVSITADGAVMTGVNPAVSTAPMNVPPSTDDDDDTMPGSPDWEAVDAQTATQAAMALMQAAELIRQFAQREAIEVAAGEGNDIFDAGSAAAAMTGVSNALGIMAQLAFHEGLEAQKGIEDGEAVKAGKRLSNKSIAALATARDHLNTLLGDDDPSKAKSDDDDDDNDAVGKYIETANKALLIEEIKDMSTEELEKVLDARDERLVGLIADALKGKAMDDQTTSVSNAKDANNKSKKKTPKAEDTDLEDEAMQGDNESASGTNQATGAAKAEGEDEEVETVEKAELTPEEIEAKRAAKEAKKALKAARKAEKEAAENAAVQKAIAEGVAEATAAVVALQDRLATVEKMAAPSSLVRTRPQEALTKSVERDELELRLAAVERIARETPDHDIRKAKREEAAEIRNQIASLSA